MSERFDADVLLLAAGYGARLQPLTLTTPKPLLEVGGKPLIEWSLDHCVRAGVERVIINLFHLGGQIRDRLGDGSRFGLKIEYSSEPSLLDTGGAVKFIESRLQHEQLLVVNSDTLFGVDLSFRNLLAAHRLNPARPAVTALVRTDPDAEKYGSLTLDSTGRVSAFLGRQFSEAVPGERRVMFAGAHMLSRRALSVMPPTGTAFSITRDTWMTLLERGEPIFGLVYDGYWTDVGTPERLAAASKLLGQTAV